MSTAIAFVCDVNYLTPTIGSALAARFQTRDPAVEVFVFVLDADAGLIARLSARLAGRNVKVVAAPVAQLASLDPDDFSRTHVPLSSLGRLWLHDFLPPTVTRVLYLDGDLDITGPLDPLLALPVPAGGFLAAADLPLLTEGDFGASARRTRAYLADLGIERASRYFNAGVLLIDRAGWNRISVAARDYILAHPDRCPYHDQSALNAVAGAARGDLSLIWNYQSDFMAVADPRAWGIEPIIWHFTGFPKAWHGDVFPWAHGFGTCFQKGREALGVLAAAEGEGGVEEDCVSHGRVAREKIRRRLAWTYPWRRLRRAARIRRALAAAA